MIKRIGYLYEKMIEIENYATVTISKMNGCTRTSIKKHAGG